LHKLVSAVKPQILFVSIARDEPYLFGDTALVLSTAKSGAITFRMRDGKICVEEFAKHRRTSDVDRNSSSNRIAPEEKK